MSRRRVAIVAVMLCFLSVAARAQQTPSDEEIRTAIAQLGEGTDTNGFAHFEVLYKNPHRSTQLLISSLKPARRGQYLTGKHPQVVWNIRELRSLTGLNFRGHTHADLTEDE